MKIILIIFLLPLTNSLNERTRTIEEVKPDGCEQTWIKFSSKCYKFVSRNEKYFERAMKLCQVEQSNLLMIKNEETQNFIMNFAFPEKYGTYDRSDENYIRPDYVMPVVWLGIKPVVQERTVRIADFNMSRMKYWLDGTPVKYHRFISGYWDYHFGNSKRNNRYYEWFYFVLRVTNNTEWCNYHYREQRKLTPCIVGEWIISPGDGSSTTQDEVYGVICEKDIINSSSSFSNNLTAAIIFFNICFLFIRYSKE